MHGKHWQPRVIAAHDLENFRRNGATHRLDGLADDGDGSGQYAKAALYYECLINLCGEEFFDDIYRCGVGNPRTKTHKGHELTVSDVHAVYNAWQLSRYLYDPEHIVEIGAGYGALSACLRRLYPDARITIVDLPEHHVFQRYYLEQSVGLDGITITTEPPEDADAVIALRCLMEMPPSEVGRYIQWAQALPTMPLFYLVARYIKTTMLKEYPFDDRWAALLSQPTFIQANMHEFILSRLANPSPIFGMQLESLPPYVCEGSIIDFPFNHLQYADSIGDWKAKQDAQHGV